MSSGRTSGQVRADFRHTDRASSGISSGQFQPDFAQSSSKVRWRIIGQVSPKARALQFRRTPGKVRAKFGPNSGIISGKFFAENSGKVRAKFGQEFRQGPGLDPGNALGLISFKVSCKFWAKNSAKVWCKVRAKFGPTSVPPFSLGFWHKVWILVHGLLQYI